MKSGQQVHRVPQVQGHHWSGDPVVMGGLRKSSYFITYIYIYMLGKKVVIAVIHLGISEIEENSADGQPVRSKYFNKLFMTYFKRRH